MIVYKHQFRFCFKFFVCFFYSYWLHEITDKTLGYLFFFPFHYFSSSLCRSYSPHQLSLLSTCILRACCPSLPSSFSLVLQFLRDGGKVMTVTFLSLQLISFILSSKRLLKFIKSNQSSVKQDQEEFVLAGKDEKK